MRMLLDECLLDDLELARGPKAWQIYTVNANGGDFQPLLKENRNAADPSWAPDGQSIAFGRLSERT